MPRILQAIITPRSGHADGIYHNDVALLDCIPKRRPINLGYMIIHHMLSIPAMVNRSLLYGNFITRILRFFIPINEPTKPIRDEIIYNLGFIVKIGHG